MATTMNSGSLTDLRDRDVDDTAVFYRSGKSHGMDCPGDGGVLGSDEGSGSAAVAFFRGNHQEREF